MENFKDLKILKWKCNHDNNGNNGYRKVYEPIIKDDCIEFHTTEMKKKISIQLNLNIHLVYY